MKDEPFYFDDDAGKRHPTRDPSVRFSLSSNRSRHPQSDEWVLLGVGLQYVVDPPNPQKKKHRGRPCQLVEFNDSFDPDRALVTFLDGRGRSGVVDVSDLRPMNEQERASLGTAPWAPKPPPIPAARTSGLARTRFTAEDRRSRPAREDVEALWNASTRLDAPELASDPEATHFLGEFHRLFKTTPQWLAQPDVGRWLPSYDTLPCRWWGSKNESTFYRLALRAYEPDGTLACIHALLTKEDVGIKTGQPVGRVRTRWPRPYHTDGLLLADEVGAAALRGEPAPNLFGLLITGDVLDFLFMSSVAVSASPRLPGPLGVFCIPTGSTWDIFRQVRWPKEVICFYTAASRSNDSTGTQRKLEEVLGPDVIVQELKILPKEGGGIPPVDKSGTGEAQAPSAPLPEEKSSTAAAGEKPGGGPSDVPRSERGPTRGPKPTDWTGTVSRSTGGGASTYVFRFGSTDVWKVGWTSHVDERLAEVNKHVPVEVTLAGWERALEHPHPSGTEAYAMEQRILQLLDEHRTDGERVRCAEEDVRNAWALALRG